MNLIYLLNFLVSLIGTVVLLGGTLLIFSQSFTNRPNPQARRALAFMLLMWTFFAFVATTESPEQSSSLRLMSVFTLTTGIFSAIASLLYPLELSRPGWLTTRNIIRLMAPGAAVTAVYFLGVWYFGESIRNLSSIDEMTDHIGEFNVWFRFILYLTVCFYVAQLLLSTNITALKYHKQSLGDTTPLDPHMVSWLRIYNIGMICLLVIYLAVLLHGSGITQFIHRVAFVTVGCFTVYMAGFSSIQNLKKA